MIKYPNWPQGIVIVITVFILFKVAFIIFSRFHKVDLVSSDYYQQEINYQQQIDRQNRTHSLLKDIRCEYDKSAEMLKIVFPANTAKSNLSGDIYFFRPSDAKQDKWFSLILNAGGEQNIDVRNLPKGLWRIKIKWLIQSEDYYFEESIVF